MKKEPRPFVWHKRSGKILSSKVLKTQESPTGEARKAIPLDETPAQRFLKTLRQQIHKNFIFCLFFILGGFCFVLASGCVKKEDAVLPLGKWKREGTFLGGKLISEKKAVLTLTERTFKMAEGVCEVKGLASYQPHAMILKVEKTDCQGFSSRKNIYYGFDLDPADGKLRVFYNNRYNDTIKDVYRKIE